MRNMKTLSRTLLLSVAVAAVAVNLHCNKLGEADRGAKSAAHSSTSAYISVHSRDVDEQAMLDTVTKSYALMATTDSILLRCINEDNAEDGRKRDRIRNTKYFTGDLTETIKNLRRDLRVTAVPGTNLIRVSMNWKNPYERCEIINAVADAIVYTATLRHKMRTATQMKCLNTRLDDLLSTMTARQKEIVLICGMSEVPIMRARNTILLDSLAALSSAITSLRLQKARAQADLDNLKEKQKSGALAKSPEIRSEIAKDPDVAELRSAILQSRITLLGDKDNRQLIVIQRTLEEMLATRQKVATLEAIHLKLSKLETEAATVSEQLLEVGNMYNETSEGLRDLGASLTRIERIESEIDRIEQQLSEVNARLLRLRIDLDDDPLAVHAPAEMG